MTIIEKQSYIVSYYKLISFYDRPSFKTTWHEVMLAQNLPRLV